jgi:capsular polysaccharide biosynthesis protein
MVTTVAVPSRTIGSGNAGDDLVRAIIRHWPLVATAAATLMVLGWLFAAVQPKRYRATAIGAVAPLVEKLDTTDVLRGVDALERRVVVSTVAALAATQAVKLQAVPPNQHGYSINATVVPNTNLFNVDVEGSDPRVVADVANRVPAILAPSAISMYKLYRVTLVSAAVVPKAPFLPRKGRAAAAGLFLGLIAGAALAYLAERRRMQATTSA